jgi:hypothetical protein
MILTTRPEDPRRHDPTLPKELVTICLKCLEKIPRDRYACAKDLAADLKLWMSDEAIRGKPVSLWKRTWRWGRNHPFGMAALITLGVTTAGMAVMTNLWGVAQQQRENAISERDRLAAVSYTQQLSIAQVCGQEQRYGEMFDILEQCPVDLRGWEWNYLTDQCRLGAFASHQDPHGPCRLCSGRHVLPRQSAFHFSRGRPNRHRVAH